EDDEDLARSVCTYLRHDLPIRNPLRTSHRLDPEIGEPTAGCSRLRAHVRIRRERDPDRRCGFCRLARCSIQRSPGWDRAVPQPGAIVLAPQQRATRSNGASRYARTGDCGPSASQVSSRERAVLRTWEITSGKGRVAFRDSQTAQMALIEHLRGAGCRD